MASHPPASFSIGYNITSRYKLVIKYSTVVHITRNTNRVHTTDTDFTGTESQNVSVLVPMPGVNNFHTRYRTGSDMGIYTESAVSTYSPCHAGDNLK